MLLTIEDLQALPGMNNLAARPIAWLNRLVLGADRAVKRYCKRDLELAFYVDFHDGNQQQKFTANQYPVRVGQTTIASGSNGAVLPQTTINVASVSGFHPGSAGNPNYDPLPGFGVQTGVSTYTYVTYTGVLPNVGNPGATPAFTGCSGGTGTLSSGPNNAVFSPVVWLDPGAYSGQAPNAFANGTMQVLGTQFYVPLDKGASRRRSERGLIEKLGGQGTGSFGWWPGVVWQGGKLAATQLPIWQRGSRNIKIAFAAGYGRYDNELDDLNYAAVMLAAQMIRIQADGANLQSENLGSYSYSVLVSADNPEMGEVRRVLAPYRETSFSSG